MDIFTVMLWLAAGLVGLMSGTLSGAMMQIRGNGILSTKRLFLRGLVAVLFVTYFWLDPIKGKDNLKIFTDQSLFPLFLLSIVIALVTNLVWQILFHIGHCKRQRAQLGRTA